MQKPAAVDGVCSSISQDCYDTENLFAIAKQITIADTIKVSTTAGNQR